MREERVEFQVDGEKVVGVLRGRCTEPGPALVFDGPLTSVKEQVVGNYARAMAERGFVTLAIDHRHFGESGGEPRNFENPKKKAQDTRAAIEFLATRPEVDGDRIGAVGVCAGAGYLAGALAEEPRIRAWGTVAGFFHDVEKQREWMGDGFDQAMSKARKAREKFESSGVSDEIPAVGDGEVAMPLKEAFDYYGTERGAVPNYKNAFAVMSREHTLPWDSMTAAAKIDIPTLMIHSENALAPALARKFYELLPGPKAIQWVESRGQIDFYDESERIDPAADALAEHFNAHLRKA